MFFYLSIAPWCAVCFAAVLYFCAEVVKDRRRK
jgi:hypothetical protein